MSVALEDLRVKVAAALAPVADDDPDVLTGLADSIQPPCLMLGPISGRLSRTACLWEVTGVVACVSGRLEPGEGLNDLDRLVAYTLRRFAVETEWTAQAWPEAQAFLVGGVTYLATRVSYDALVTV